MTCLRGLQMKMLAKKLERPLAVDGVARFEIFNGQAVRYAHALVEMLHQHELGSDTLICFSLIASILPSVLGHIWPRSHQAGHLGIIDHIHGIEFIQIVAVIERENSPRIDICHAPHKVIEISRTNIESVAIEEWWNPHRRFAAVGHSIE